MLRRMIRNLPSVRAACLRCGDLAEVSGSGHCAACRAKVLPYLQAVLRSRRPAPATLRIRYTYGQIGVAALLGSLSTAIVFSVILARGGRLAPGSRAEPGAAAGPARSARFR